MNGHYIYSMSHLTKKINQKEILKDVGLSFYPGAKIGVLGKNGAGKSTILKIMAGLDKDYEGEAKLTAGYTVGFVQQEPQLDPNLSVRGNLEQAVAKQLAVFARQSEIWTRMGEGIDDDEMEKLTNELGRIDAQIEQLGLTDVDDINRQLEIARDAMQLPPDDADVSKLSGGERRRVALCKVLLEKPDLLLLDEPTNHLDAESVQWLEQHLQAYKGTVVAVTHDRYFLDNVAQWILEIERGRCYPYEGNYSTYLEKKQARMAIEEKKEAARAKTLARELEWIRASPKARQSKSKARVNAYEKMAAEQFEEREDEFELQIPPGKNLGDLVVEFKNVSKAYGDRLLIEDLSFRLPAGGIIGVIGPNGAGKTTLFRMLVGHEKPDSGSIRLGETVQLGYVDQSRDALDPEHNIWEEISGGLDHFMVGDKKLPTRSYVAKFNFKGTDQQKKVGVLSGGERNRVHLAKLLRRGCNLLLLDEPTNDLDVDTLRALEDAVTNFVGCVVCISHDRWFLDRTCTHILAFEGDGHVHWCEGGYSIYEQQRHERMGADADQPHRFRYKKLHHDK